MVNSNNNSMSLNYSKILEISRRRVIFCDPELTGYYTNTNGNNNNNFIGYNNIHSALIDNYSFVGYTTNINYEFLNCNL
jgi:hypothetical protein